MKRFTIKKISPKDERVTVVPVTSRRLIKHTIGDAIAFHLVADSIIWVKPRAETTAEEMAAYVEFLKTQGAARVLPMPIEARAAAVAGSAADAAFEQGDTFSVREACQELLAEVKELKEEVSAQVEDMLSQAGL